MAVYKIGSTVQILIEFTEDEFDAVFPNEEFVAECEITGGVEYPMIVTTDAVNRTVLLRADTTNWTKGRYKCDIRVRKNGIVTFIPQNSYIEFELIAPVTEAGSVVQT